VHVSSIIDRPRRAGLKASTAAAPAAAPAEAQPSPFGGDRMLSRDEVCGRTGKTFATIWSWMRAGKFPRARSASPGGTPMWLESEVVQWMRDLPIKPYLGDEPAPAPVAAPQKPESVRRAKAAKRRANVKKRRAA
jgi:predicted DNA-binding transcriptional regulator AlpA